MARPNNFLWTNPGIPSLTVPYHDTNDFYYSGHVGACVVYLSEFYCQGSIFMYLFCGIILIAEWSLLTSLKTHYIIDLMSGLMIAHCCHITAEWLSYYMDVKLCGWSASKRNQTYHSACKKCGWSNQKIDCKIGKNEYHFLKKTYSIRKVIEKNERISL